MPITIGGGAKYELGDYEGAIEDYDRAIALDPKDAYAHNNRGNIYRRMKDIIQARKDVQKSLELDDSNGWAYATLAMIYADEGDEELYYKNLEIAISKPLPYPLVEKLEEEETLQKFKEVPRFQVLLKKSREN